MAEEQDTTKQDLEDYLALYSMEECLDEIMNTIVVERPPNPYVAIGQLFEAKTKAEIVDIQFRPIIVSGEFGVQALLVTNITTFCGVASYSSAPSMDPVEGENPKELKNYDMLRDKIRDAVLEICPTNLAKLDQAVADLAGVNPAEALALSIACTRAAARHKGLKLYQFVAHAAGLKESELRLPVPAAAVLSKLIDGGTQDISLTPVAASSFPHALEKLLQVSALVRSAEHVQPNLSAWGSPSMNCKSVAEASKVVHQVLESHNLLSDFKQGLHLHAEKLVHTTDTEEPVYKYAYDGPAPVVALSGADSVEQLTSLWVQTDLLTLEGLAVPKDHDTLKLLRQKVLEITYDLKASGSDSLAYCLPGVGGDASCCLQVPLDALTFSQIDNVEQYMQEMPHNCISLSLAHFTSVSQALDVVRKARATRWPVTVYASDSSYLPESSDPFLADFAVGVGASQVLFGGLQGAQFLSKYNRLMEIAEESPDIQYGRSFRQM
ncbi:enolase C-terminal domain-like protein [Ochromonadaceae sp. CCMP2298]|nr:enolase C-terminal domain-like protein [Ochromonadaceae sp. CCMP2298]